ncbi:MAG TPA: class I SAM-dependent methyltransferase [Drouetiella sp.]|jgi:hypothetical protein
MTKSQLTLSDGIDLHPTNVRGIARAVVIDDSKRHALTWDRFCRINKTAEHVRNLANAKSTILDVGGFDGALAFFLPEFSIDIIDPETTGGTGFDIAENSYDIVISIDALEHIEPAERKRFLETSARAARTHCFINFPAQRSANAQALIYELTGNPLVHDHVRWNLPDSREVEKQLTDCGYASRTIEHTSIAQWVSQYLLQGSDAEKASKACQYLINHHFEESGVALLYDLVIAVRTELQ